MQFQRQLMQMLWQVPPSRSSSMIFLSTADGIRRGPVQHFPFTIRRRALSWPMWRMPAHKKFRPRLMRQRCFSGLVGATCPGPCRNHAQNSRADA